MPIRSLELRNVCNVCTWNWNWFLSHAKTSLEFFEKHMLKPKPKPKDLEIKRTRLKPLREKSRNKYYNVKMNGGSLHQEELHWSQLM